MLSMKRRVALVLVLAASSAVSVSAFGEPVDDQKITSAIEAYQAQDKSIARGAAGTEARTKLANETIASLSVADLSAEQIERLSKARILGFASDHRDALASRLETLAGDPSLAGFKASVMRMDFIRYSKAQDQTPEQAREIFNQRQSEAFHKLLAHPAMNEAAKGSELEAVFGRVGNSDPALFQNGTLAKQLMGYIGNDMTPRAALNSVALFDSLANEESGASRELVQQVRTKLLGALEHASKKPDIDENLSKWLGSRTTYLNGAYARGELVGHQAPEIEFIWTNPSLSAKRLSDLKGKVVVLDFWATWCGPCIGSFPQVRDLQAHYKDYPVAIVGVTSLQGYHMARRTPDEKPTRIETKDNPSEEQRLMGEYIPVMDITWHVAFGTTDVFNPDYGVRGIPHVAIIDPNGVVRFRGLHPGSDPEKKHEMINGLLKEFGLPFPKEEPGEKKKATAGN